MSEPIRLHVSALIHAVSEQDCGAQKHAVAAIEREVAALRERAERAERERDACKLEAQIHAQEARTANASLAECYQAVTGNTGEPGNWHGANPVKQRIANLEAERAALMEAGKVLATDKPIAKYRDAWHVCYGSPGALAAWMAKEGGNETV